MSGYQLEATDGSGSHTFPAGQTVIGRGPLLGIADKRVSRCHAVLDLVDDQLRIKSTHVNPCFYQSGGKGSFVPLERNEWRWLRRGDCIALLPDKYSFRVITNNPSEEATLRNSCGLDEESELNGNSSPRSPVSSETRAASPLQHGPSSLTAANTKTNRKPCSTVPPEDDVKPVQRKRVLPDWMLQGDLSVQALPPPVVTAGKKKRTRTQRTQRAPLRKPKDEADPGMKPSETVRGLLLPARQPIHSGPRASDTASIPNRGEQPAIPQSQREPADKDHSKSEGRDSEEVDALKIKFADIEHRNRRNNVKFRGIPEAIQASEITIYIQQMIKTILPDASTMDLTIDRAHRLPKPKFVPDSMPRDVIAKFHFFHIKEAMMQASRKLNQMLAPYNAIRLYTDLSQMTLQARRKFSLITNALRQAKMPYKWGFPPKLLIHKDGAIHIFSNPEDAIEKFFSFSRKNPVHFQEFSHPGDADYRNVGDGSQDDDDDRPECPYGTDCYRKNPQHKLEYKHTKPPGRKLRKRNPKKAQRSVLDGDSDDDGVPNEYHDEDSFINDDSEEEDFDLTDEDSDWMPDSQDKNSEDVKDLLKEAKKFVRGKR
ncbi:aprataxin and PNK-like factor [Eleutherodactylus coqui]|uniref:aprataxin and PNK-like factor n=1 Tax=Eleutherodactylus coqui TaxID=57060 RepID=UPI0034627F16